ncbi:hypothetical protein THAOC_24096, partial [Thalassiosira oceanica]
MISWRGKEGRTLDNQPRAGYKERLASWKLRRDATGSGRPPRAAPRAAAPEGPGGHRHH